MFNKIFSIFVVLLVFLHISDSQRVFDMMDQQTNFMKPSTRFFNKIPLQTIYQRRNYFSGPFRFSMRKDFQK
ncbi:unnamed protein product [Caenorhabditis angaria]|uniref:Uncharacterized protein n=1 Tax=Caenorhabditis angaria TaxID=860376 RepID=A0A9P1IX64_9PELO|nr:unnamed protein product [Caenorhabditis angaria]